MTGVVELYFEKGSSARRRREVRSQRAGGREGGRRNELTCSFIRRFDPVSELKSCSVGGSERFPFPERKRTQEEIEGWMDQLSFPLSSSTPFPSLPLLPLPFLFPLLESESTFTI